MYKRLYIIAIVPTKIGHTIYLFERKLKIVVPVQVEGTVAKQLIVSESKTEPGIYNTVWRLINGFGGKMVSVSIYNFINSKLYSYLNISFQNKHLEFNASIGDALNIAKRFSAPIYIKMDILEKCGIRVSAKMLREALNE